MKIIDYSTSRTTEDKGVHSLGEGITAALLFLVPALLLFVLAR